MRTEKTIDWMAVNEGIRLNVRVAVWCGIGIVTLQTRLDRSLRLESETKFGEMRNAKCEMRNEK